MVVKGSSYAAIGWRPQALTAACKAFPFLDDSFAVNSTDETQPPFPLGQPIVEGRTKNQNPSEPVAEPKPEPEPEPQPEPESKHEPKPEPEPVVEPQAQPQSESEPKPEPSAEPVPSAEPEPEPETSAPSHDHESAGSELPGATTEAPSTTKRPFVKPRPVSLLSRSANGNVVTPRAVPRAPPSSSVATPTTTEPSPVTSPTTVQTITTTKKLSPLDRLIAKNKQAQSRTSTTTEPPTPVPLGGRGFATEVLLTDLPEASINTETAARSRRDTSGKLQGQIVTTLTNRVDCNTKTNKLQNSVLTLCQRLPKLK